MKEGHILYTYKYIYIYVLYMCVYIYIYIYIYIYTTHALEQMMYDYAHLASVRFEYSVCR